MRASQLIETSPGNNFEPEIESLLTAALAMNVTTINTQTLLADIVGLGYTIDLTTLLAALEDVPMVSSANKDIIELRSTEPETANDSDSKTISKGRVDRMAKKQARKDMGESLDEIRQLAGIRRTT
jgi:hypothetical protein